MKRYLSILFVLFISLGMHAQSAMSFLRIDRNPSTAAMAGAEALSPLYNAAAIPFADKSDAIFSYQMWSPSTLPSNNFNILGAVKIGKKMGVNIIAAQQIGAPYTIADISGKEGDEFTPKDLVVGAGFGIGFTENLSAGATLRFASQTIAESAKYSSISADVFVEYVLGGLKATGGIASIGPKVKSGDNSYALPASVKLGVGYGLPINDFSLDARADFDYYFAGGIGLSAGAEFGFKDMVFVRAGGRVGTGTSPVPTHLALGLGAKFFGVHLDLCYLTANEIIGNTLMAGIGYSF